MPDRPGHTRARGREAFDPLPPSPVVPLTALGAAAAAAQQGLAGGFEQRQRARETTISALLARRQAEDASALERARITARARGAGAAGREQITDFISPASGRIKTRREGINNRLKNLRTAREQPVNIQRRDELDQEILAEEQKLADLEGIEDAAVKRDDATRALTKEGQRTFSNRMAPIGGLAGLPMSEQQFEAIKRRTIGDLKKGDPVRRAIEAEFDFGRRFGIFIVPGPTAPTRLPGPPTPDRSQTIQSTILSRVSEDIFEKVAAQGFQGPRGAETFSSAQDKVLNKAASRLVPILVRNKIVNPRQDRGELFEKGVLNEVRSVINSLVIERIRRPSAIPTQLPFPPPSPGEIPPLRPAPVTTPTPVEPRAALGGAALPGVLGSLQTIQGLAATAGIPGPPGVEALPPPVPTLPEAPPPGLLGADVQAAGTQLAGAPRLPLPGELPGAAVVRQGDVVIDQPRPEVMRFVQGLSRDAALNVDDQAELSDLLEDLVDDEDVISLE